MLALSRLQDEAGDEAGARAWLERSLKVVSSHVSTRGGSTARRRCGVSTTWTSARSQKYLPGHDAPAGPRPSAALCAAVQQPIFRTGTDLVRIDALVERDGKPVGGLTSDDFEVFDNGVRQHVVSVRQNERVSLAIALDASGSMQGPRIAKVKEATLALLGQLHADEPLVVVGFAEQARAAGVAPRTTPADARAMLDEGSSPRGATALFDGAYAAVLAGDTGTGSKLLVLLTDGRNNASWLSARNVIDDPRDATRS